MYCLFSKKDEEVPEVFNDYVFYNKEGEKEERKSRRERGEEHASAQRGGAATKERRQNETGRII